MTYSHIKYKDVNGRYLPLEKLETFLDDFGFEKQIIGYSVLQQPIYAIQIGTGKSKVLMWSQMHGNESTTTKAVLDLLSTYKKDNALVEYILKQCTLYIIPILNPDGANAYTRVNANKVDLNRDAEVLTQPESIVLRKAFDTFKPDFCFNLHDQRTIFNVGNKEKPATVSFLAPSEDHDCTITPTRKKAMYIIGKMITALNNDIEGQIGRFDDAFNSNCVGDKFTTFGVPTILFEAGHYKNDYQREDTRYFIYKALITALETISSHHIEENTDVYFSVAENQKLYYDIIIKNLKIRSKNKVISKDIAILYREILQNNNIEFFPVVEIVGNLPYNYGHKVIDANGSNYVLPNIELLYETNIIDILSKL